MTGYVRKDTTNNIADGNVINAADFDNEFDGIVAAFHASTGHTHDGTASEGAPITKIGPSQDVVASSTALTPKTTATVDIGSSSLKFKDLFLSGAVSLAGQITSTLATGTAPLVVASTTKVTNLNADLLDGGDWAAPGSIGATTANAGAFTTLTTSSTVTHNGGTANGVAYLNGSKVLTTGSALTFDGNTLVATNTSGNAVVASRGSKNLGFTGNYAGANTHAVISTTTGMALAFMDESSEFMRLTSTGLGIGTSSPAIKLDVRGSGPSGINVGESLSASTNSSRLFFSNATAGQAFAIYNANNALVFTNGATAGSTTGSEVMRIDSSGNLGIGTSSPGGKLDIYQNSARYVRAYPSSGLADFEVVTNNNVQPVFAVKGTGTADLIRAYAGATQAFTLDSSGNLGLGVTPSASNLAGFLEGGYGTFGQTTSLGTSIAGNAYYNSGWKYKLSSTATLQLQDSSGFKWHTAPSGTAGNAITFTQAMTLDASGNLGVGQTSPGVSGIDILKSGGTSTYVRTSDGTYTMLSGVAPALGGGVVGTTSNHALLFYTNNTERARITSAGNFCIGSSEPGNAGSLNLSVGNPGTTIGGFQLWSTTAGTHYVQFGDSAAGAGPYSGAIGYSHSSDAMLFLTAATERARITSGGEFLVGTTTVGAGIKSKTYYASSTAGNFIDSWYSDSGSAENLRAAFRVDGGLANYSANNVNLSDRREKTNFAPAKSYIDVICAIPVQTFNFIGQTDDEKTLGVVAQDVQAVAPELVSESNWGTDDNPKMRLGIYQTDLQYALMKCIQEQQVMINELKAKVAALEAK